MDAEEPRAFANKEGAEPFASCKGRVAHRLEDAGLRPIGARQHPVEQRLDGALRARDRRLEGSCGCGHLNAYSTSRGAVPEGSPLAESVIFSTLASAALRRASQ